MRTCVVCGARSADGVHLHSLPKGERIKNEWLKWLRQVCAKTLPKTILVCDHHFVACGKRLGKEAVPTIPAPTENEVALPIPPKEFTSSTIINLQSLEHMNPCNVHSSTLEDKQSNQNIETYSRVIYINDIGDMNCNELNMTTVEEMCYEREHQGSVCSQQSEKLGLLEGITHEELCEDKSKDSTHRSYKFDPHGNCYTNVMEIDMNSMVTTNPDFLNGSGTMIKDCLHGEHGIIECSMIDEEISGLPRTLNEPLMEMADGTVTIDVHDNCKTRLIDSNMNNEGNADTNLLNKTASPSTFQGWRSCAVQGCYKTLQNHNQRSKMHTFPAIAINGLINTTNLEICKEWVKLSGNKKLLQVESASLHKKYFICDSHFSNGQFYNKNRDKLLPNQIPSENVNQPLSDIEMEKFPVLGHNLDVFIDTEGVAMSRFDKVLNERNIKDKHYKEFQKQMENLKEYHCPNCKETFWSNRKLKTNCLHKNNCHKFTKLNDMDPGEVPEALKDLTMIEEALISPSHAMLSVYKIKGHQLGYSGNVINFPQAVSEVVDQLPYKVSDLPAIISVRTQAVDEEPKDFHVRSNKVREALLWLKQNNPFYEDITISEENICLFPDDGNVYDQIPSLIVPETENIVDEASDHRTENNNEDNIENVNELHQNHNKSLDTAEKNIERNCSSTNELNTDTTNEEIYNGIQESFVPKQCNKNQNEQIQEVFNWPSIGKDPINEFQDKGLIAKAFPCLFPYGCADLRQERQYKVSESQYFQHMMRYHDGRFAKHPKFRFYAMNSLMRWNAITKGSLYVRNHEEFKNMDMEQLKNHIRENPSSLNKIMYQCSNMRGTKPYWKARHDELVAMIEQIGMPTVFFTLSAADLHWPGLFHLLAPNENMETLTEKRRRDLIAENPILVDKYFSERVKAFLSKVVNPKFEVEDYWYRVEYQHRGSPHIHGLLKLKGAPDVNNLPGKSVEELQEIVDYFDTLIYCEHPDVNAPTPAIHSCRIELENVIDLKRDLAELLNTVQRHTRCTPGYCLRSKSKSNEKHTCRFNFPKDLKENSQLQTSEKGEIEFEFKRNDPRLNNYNPDMILIWRANLDISPVLSKRALLNYLAKYVSKSETKSKSLEDLFRDTCVSTSKSAKSIIQSLYIKACSERDYSAQEVGHILMGENMVQCSRSFVFIYLKSDDEWVKIQSKDTTYGESLLQKYSKRADIFENKSLWYMAKNYNFSTRRFRRTKAIVVVFPKALFKADKGSNEKYFRLQVLLHAHWRSVDEFKIKYPDASWKTIYDNHIEQIRKENESDQLISVQEELDKEMDVQEDDFTDESYAVSTEDWMALSAMRPDQSTQNVEIGRRAIDELHNWNSSYEKYMKYGTVEELQTFISKQKKEYQMPMRNIEFPNVIFNAEQSKVLSLVEKQIKLINTGGKFVEAKVPKSIIIQGSAGTGKSLIIRALRFKVESVLSQKSILILAPTGVAALNIEGMTIHSVLRINTNVEFTDLENEASRKFCNDLKDIKFVVIDEYSMVGCKMIGMIDKRLKQVTGNYNESFGGLCIYFFGDIHQLPPVLDTPVYTKSIPYDPLKLHGKFVWETILDSIVLTEVHRQSDAEFKQVLKNISHGQATTEDYNSLKRRFKQNVGAEERRSFNDAVKLFPLKDQVNMENMQYLEKLKVPSTNLPVPVAIVPARHNCPEAESGSSDQAGGLSSMLYLAPSCKIMLRSNLWTLQGLVNGSIGCLVDLIYEPGKKPPYDIPAVLICKFKNYSGPYLGNDDSLKLVPIPVMTRAWTTKDGISCTRLQFPVQIACALTVHKSQGLTL